MGLALILGLAAAIAALILCGSLAFIAYLKFFRAGVLSSSPTSDVELGADEGQAADVSKLAISPQKDADVRRHRWQEVEALLGDRAAAAVIGEGGFSTVYLARLPDSTLAALKVYAGGGGDLPRRAFRQELDVLLRLRHPRIVRLLAYSDDREGFVMDCRRRRRRRRGSDVGVRTERDAPREAPWWWLHPAMGRAHACRVRGRRCRRVSPRRRRLQPPDRPRRPDDGERAPPCRSRPQALRLRVGPGRILGGGPAGGASGGVTGLHRPALPPDRDRLQENGRVQLRGPPPGTPNGTPSRRIGGRNDAGGGDGAAAAGRGEWGGGGGGSQVGWRVRRGGGGSYGGDRRILRRGATNLEAVDDGDTEHHAGGGGIVGDVDLR
ncbi:uncharacterized protein LOC135678398 isoform X2 [Musa acuminata AAA Group]|uniref:uncharacterized protein LOC135678398 isoform X2 n=1 Tax=Musa acuminata AAA Group TaxID=214697 RepID=UPI0031DA1C07